MKNVLITGASGGIGYELVQLFLEANHNVMAVSRNTKELAKIKNEKLWIVEADITTDKGRKQIKEQVKKGGELCILINNAGALVNKPFAKITDKELRDVYEANVFAPFQLLQQLIPLMGKTQRAHVVNIGSMGGYQGSAKFSGLTAYSSSKFAIAGLTEILAEEFKDKNIAFNCLAIGAAQTKMLAKAFPGYKAPVSATQMAEFIMDFSLHSHNYINGKIIPVSLSTP
ncbi:MAG: SDR family oxidoreductase [Bacteroidota bacterium]|nr:SDR family oxidoreductase [Bacteroidota bacterium]